jgi:vacuolar-type H+-ATPase subunit I/STV1
MSGRSRNSFGESFHRRLLHLNTHLVYSRQAKESRRLLGEQLAKFTASSPDLESIRREIIEAREEAAACRRKLEERQTLSCTGSDADRLKESEETAKQIQSLKLQVEQANTVSYMLQCDVIAN